MKTVELIEHLALQARAVPSARGLKSWVPVGVGWVITTGIFGVLYPLQPLAELSSVPIGYLFRWLVLLALVFCLIRTSHRLVQPATSWRVRCFDGIWPVSLLAVAAGVQILTTRPPVSDDTWRIAAGIACAQSLVFLSLPTMVGLFMVARRWPVTRPTLTGAFLGACSAAMTALLYTLHCRETDPAFVMLWYGLGIAVPSLLGSATGRRLLHC